MALNPILKFKIGNHSCTDLIVYETTGAYSATNTGGYGAPNYATTDIISYSLQITDPDSNVYTIDLFATTNFPTVNSTVEYTIPLSSIGNRTYIEDGYWQFKWIVVAQEGPETLVTYTNNSAYYFSCNAECCVADLLAKIELDDDQCNCDSSKSIEDYLKAKAFLDALKNAAFCGKLTLFTNLAKAIEKLCKKTSCKTCN